MMKKFTYLSLFIGLLLITPSSRAIVFQVNRWWHPKLQQEVNVLKDDHTDRNDYCATYNQRQDIIEREHISFRIIEDMSEYYLFLQDPAAREAVKKICTEVTPKPTKIKRIETYGYDTQELFNYYNSYAKNDFSPSVMASVMHSLHHLENTYNVEFRYMLQCTYDRIIKTNDPKAFQPLMKEIGDIVAEINAYNDGPMLNAYYQKVLQSSMANLNNSRSSLKSLEDACFAIIDTMAPLLDTRALHVLHHNPDKKIIDIIVGAKHGNGIEQGIKELGYKKMSSTGIDSHVLFEQPDQATVIPVIDIKKTLAEPLADIVKKPIKSKL